jgi:hypothetical protein
LQTVAVACAGTSTAEVPICRCVDDAIRWIGRIAVWCVERGIGVTSVVYVSELGVAAGAIRSGRCANSADLHVLRAGSKAESEQPDCNVALRLHRHLLRACLLA